MRRMILFLLTVSILNAGVFSAIEGFTFEEREPKYKYTIDTAGINPRIYEFTTKTDKNIICIVVFSSSDKSSVPALQCIDRKLRSEK